MSMQIETGTISDTVVQYAKGFIDFDYDYYLLFDNVDYDTDIEECALVVGGKYDYENNEFVAPYNIYYFKRVPVGNVPFTSYTYTVQQYQIENQNLSFPQNNDHYVLYTNINNEYPAIYQERGLEHAQNIVGYVVMPVLLIGCIVFVLLQQIFRHNG